jgi:hypothetical protein
MTARIGTVTVRYLPITQRMTSSTAQFARALNYLVSVAFYPGVMLLTNGRVDRFIWKIQIDELQVLAKSIICESNYSVKPYRFQATYLLVVNPASTF